MRAGSLNLAWARQIVGALANRGLSEVEVTPGSRSAPLVLALHSFPEIKARTHLDERSAAFFALGYGRRTRRPAAVVTTSGTAVANLLPAVVEADASDVPMILITADRPPRLRGADANQTIDQIGIFGARVRFEADLPVPSQAGLEAAAGLANAAARRATGPPAGPVHLNVPFEKPLQPRSSDAVERWRASSERGETHEPVAVAPAEELSRSRRPPGASAVHEPVAFASAQVPDSDSAAASTLARRLASARRPIVVAGPSSDPDADGPALVRFAALGRIPLLADPLSGARFCGAVPDADRAIPGPAGGNPGSAVVCGAYDHFLRVPALVRRLAPDLILRTGRTPTSAALEAALEHWKDAVQVVIDAGSRPKDHQGLAHDYLKASPATLLGSPKPVRETSARPAPGKSSAPGKSPAATPPTDRPAPDPSWPAAWVRVESAAWFALEGAVRDPGNEGAYAAAALNALPPESTLFVSSSMPVRDLDAYGRPGPRGVRVLGNRGASGIDGIVSSVLGCAAGGPGPVAGLLGDLAFVHDMNGLLTARDRELNAVFVLVDNDGGGIFHMLPIRAFEPAFTPYFATPHGLDFRHAAKLYGVPLHDVATPEALADAVSAAIRRPGAEIVRVRTCKETNRRRHEAAREQVARRLARTFA